MLLSIADAADARLTLLLPSGLLLTLSSVSAGSAADGATCDGEVAEETASTKGPVSSSGLNTILVPEMPQPL